VTARIFKGLEYWSVGVPEFWVIGSRFDVRFSNPITPRSKHIINFLQSINDFFISIGLYSYLPNSMLDGPRHAIKQESPIWVDMRNRVWNCKPVIF